MKPLLSIHIAAALILLAACNQSANSVASAPASAPVQAASAASAASITSLAASAPKVTGNVKDYYLQSCVASALQNRPTDPKNMAMAQSICQCAYDAGVAEYGTAAEFDAAVKNSFEHPEKVDEKLLAISDKTIQACMDKHAPKQAVDKAK